MIRQSAPLRQKRSARIHVPLAGRRTWGRGAAQAEKWFQGQGSAVLHCCL